MLLRFALTLFLCGAVAPPLRAQSASLHYSAIASPTSFGGQSQSAHFSNDFDGESIGGPSVTDNGLQRTVIDPSPTGPKRFYRVEIAKP